MPPKKGGNVHTSEGTEEIDEAMFTSEESEEEQNARAYRARTSRFKEKAH